MGIRDWFKREKEILTQTIFDTWYREICPICNIMVEETKHNYTEDVETEIIMGCPTCHVALIGKKYRQIEALKTYVRDETVPLGLKVISEEVVDVKEWPCK